MRTKILEEFGDVSLTLLTRLRKAGLEAFGPLGFTPTEAMLLISIERGHAQPKELMLLLGIVMPAVSSMTTKLTEAGLLSKTVDDHDGRRVNIRLSDLGRAACDKIRKA